MSHSDAYIQRFRRLTRTSPGIAQHGEQVAKEAKERQREYYGNQYKSGLTSNLTEVHQKPLGETTEIMAKKMGISKNTSAELAAGPQQTGSIHQQLPNNSETPSRSATDREHTTVTTVPDRHQLHRLRGKTPLRTRFPDTVGDLFRQYEKSRHRGILTG